MSSRTTGAIAVTGAASGIGAALCRRLAGRGMSLLMHTGSNSEKLEGVAAEVRAQGSNVRTFVGDLSVERTAAELVDVARQGFGQLDGLVRNAEFSTGLRSNSWTMQRSNVRSRR